MHVDTLHQVRNTCWRKITRLEEDSNPYLPTTGRLFYSLNYLIFPPVIRMIWLRTRQILWSDVHQDSGDVDRLCWALIAARGLCICSSIRIILRSSKAELLFTRMLNHCRTLEWLLHSIDYSTLSRFTDRSKVCIGRWVYLEYRQKSWNATHPIICPRQVHVSSEYMHPQWIRFNKHESLTRVQKESNLEFSITGSLLSLFWVVCALGDTWIIRVAEC
jgi:hypothetical protein